MPAVELTDVVYPDEPIVCLGTSGDGEEQLIAADAAGEIFRVDLPSMALTRLAQAPSRPTWVGGYRASPDSPPSIVAILRPEDSRHVEIHDLGTGRRWTPDVMAGSMTALLDRSARLWVGSDMGEWGGWVGRIDLPDPDAELSLYPDCRMPFEDGSGGYRKDEFRCHGIYGFTELRDGRVWLHGGTLHMGSTSASIAQIETAGIVPLLENGSRSREVREDEPRLPITHILEHPSRDELRVFSYGEVYRVDRKLTRWQKAHQLELLYRPGRPDALGSYPSVTAVDWLGEDALLVSTALDGLLRLDGGGSERHAFPGELGADRIGRMKLARDGVLFFEDQAIWSHSAGDWRRLRLEPSGPPPVIEELRGYVSWRTEFAFVDSRGDLIAVSETSFSPGPRATVRWRGDASEVLAMEAEAVGSLTSGFATPDGELWALSGRGLYRLDGSGWERTATVPFETDVWWAVVEVLETDAPPWVLLEKKTGSLVQLRLEGDEARVRAVPSPGARLHDVVRWHDDWVFATSSGLERYEPRQDRFRTLELETSADADRARVLAVDGKGRLWLGGAGLWLVDEGRLIDVSAVPALRGVEVVALIADPSQSGGVIASLGERGLLHVSVE